ncbi:MAG: TIGR03016 family PEP-CTERM system-associated outer membrane protein [Candidatus Competibacteraceae bacterium]|nr:TIGR03016 family PEP-CTERM system-associated outer membrane protein [Candidatus Competibacteraceae bacterium]
MQKMKSNNRQRIGVAAWRAVALWFIPGMLLASCSLSLAQEPGVGPGLWRISPRIGVGATYSDNIRLAPSSEAEDDLVLQVEPGISINKRGGRLDLRLDYTAQGLFYTNNSDANAINNQLQAFGTGKIFQNNLFLDAYGSITQVPINTRERTDAGTLGAAGGTPASLSFFNNLDLGLPGAAELFNPMGIFNNIALTDNQVTGYRFGASPYWRQNIRNWAEVFLRYRYDTISYDNQDGNEDPQVEQQVNNADSQIHTVEFNLTDGRELSQFKWDLKYFYQQQQRDSQQVINAVNNGDDRRENVIGQLSYQLNKRWSLLAEGGYENNQVADFANNRDGGYWGLGALWEPSRFIRFKALYGPDVNELAFNWNPTTRTSLELSRRNQDVGVDPGTRWRGLLNHRTRYTTWSAAYTDEVTNEQQLLGGGLLAVGPDGQPLPLDEQGQPILFEGPSGLSDQNFRRKRFEAGVTYRRGPTGLSFNAFTEDRQNPDLASNENTHGAGALWTWRFAPRTASFVGAGWEHDDLGENELGEAQQNDYWVSVLGLAQVFSPDAGGLISYRYYKNDTDLAEQQFRENRFNIRFNMKF